MDVVIIIILGATVVVITVFVVKSVLAPKRVSQLASLVKQGKSLQAIKAAKQILVKEPRNADAHYMLAQAYLAEGKRELALMELKTVNQLGNFEGYTDELAFRKQIAELFQSFNQPEEALKEYLLLMKRDPTNAQYYVHAGELFEMRNRSDKAMQYYKKALELDSRISEAHFRLGTLSYRAKQYQEARESLEKAVRLDSDLYEAYFFIGKLQKENKEYSAALASFEKASKDSEMKVRALVERGGCYMSTGDTPRAITELERAVSLSDDDSAPELLYGRYFLATAYEKERKLEPAIQQWEKIYAKKPGFRDVAEKLSQYQELRADDRVKDYLTAGQEEFTQMCTRMAEGLALTVRDVSPIEGGCQVYAVEAQSKWRNARSVPKLIRFLRITDTVDESAVRSIHEEMKKEQVSRGIIISSANFSRLAIDYAENRPIELYKRDRLQQLLSKIEY